MDVLVLLVAVPAIHPVTVHHLRQVAAAALQAVLQVALDHAAAVARPVVPVHLSRQDVLLVQIHVAADAQPHALEHQSHPDVPVALTLVVVNVLKHVQIIVARIVQMDAVPDVIMVAKIAATVPVVQHVLAHALVVA